MAEIPYPVLSMSDIVAHVDATHGVAEDDAYLVLWTTWPKLGEWLSAASKMRWKLKTGGCWAKTGRMGLGYHWRGDSEPVLIYTKGRPKPTKAISNSYVGPRHKHSEKPHAFLQRMLEGFTSPGDLVYDVYAGMAPLWRAARNTGRQYIGCEIDAARYQQAHDLFETGALAERRVVE